MRQPDRPHRRHRPVPAKALREPLRSLHTNLQLRAMIDERRPRPALRTLLFVSAEGSDGKSTLIAGLGAGPARGGETVTIIEADLRRPVQARAARRRRSARARRGAAGGLHGARGDPGRRAPSAMRAHSRRARTGAARRGRSSRATRARSRCCPAAAPSPTRRRCWRGATMPMLLHTMAEEFD